MFTKLKQKRDVPQASPRELSLWEREFNKCSKVSDYVHYIRTFKHDSNPYFAQAKDKIDDIAFSKCQNAQEYQRYIASYPSGRHVAEAKEAIRKIQAATQAYSSTDSGILSDEVKSFLKKAIAVVVILIFIVLLFAAFTQEKTNWGIIGGYAVGILIPACKWAFDD